MIGSDSPVRVFDSEMSVKVVKSMQIRAARKLQLLCQGKLKSYKTVVPLVEDQYGLEIGGPSDVFQGWRTPSPNYKWFGPMPIYDLIRKLDNCNFAGTTIWATHAEEYRFSRKKNPGKVIIAEGSALAGVKDGAYDFVLSSHNLEHFANPVKALYEWKRITRPGGALIVVLPDFRKTFDHRREPTPIAHLFEDYRNNVGEDDPTHFSEVLELHDLERDGTLKFHSIEELRERSYQNISNRALHHHVFDEHNSTELLRKTGLEILAVELALPYHIFIVGRWKG